MTSRWRRITTATTLTLAAVLTSCGQSPAIRAISLGEGPTLLRLNPPEGQVSRYIVSVEMNMESPMMPSTSDEPVMTMRASQTQTILSATDELLRARVTIDSADTKMAIPGMPSTDLIPDLAGTVSTIEMDRRGRVLDIVYDDNFPDDLASAMEDMFETAEYFMLPEHEVSVGDSWTSETSVGLPMGEGMQVDTGLQLTYTLVGAEGSLATMTFEGTIETSLDAMGMAASGTGDFTGSTVIDLARGLYVNQESRMRLEMAVGGMTIDMDMQTTQTLVSDP